MNASSSRCSTACRRDLRRQLIEKGYRLRVYVPYGTEWYPYFMRRLAERPANVLFVVRSLASERGAVGGHAAPRQERLTLPPNESE